MPNEIREIAHEFQGEIIQKKYYGAIGQAVTGSISTA